MLQNTGSISCLYRDGVSQINANLDETDWKILKELQNNGRMTNMELSTKIDISALPCLRRIRRLEKNGIIKGYRALLDGKMLGQELVAMCFVGLHHQAEADLKAFSGLVNGWPFLCARHGLFLANPIFFFIVWRLISTVSRHLSLKNWLQRQMWIQYGLR